MSYRYIATNDPLLTKLDTALLTSLSKSNIKITEDFSRFELDDIADFPGIGAKRINELLAFNESLPFDLFNSVFPENSEKDPLRGITNGVRRGIAALRYVNRKTIDRANGYYKDGNFLQFTMIDEDESFYEGLVRGSMNKRYTTSVRLKQPEESIKPFNSLDQSITFSCTCPYNRSSYYHDMCKHTILLIMEIARRQRMEYLLHKTESNASKSFSLFQAQLQNVEHQRNLFGNPSAQSKNLRLAPPEKRELAYEISRVGGDWMLLPENFPTAELKKSYYRSDSIVEKYYPNIPAKDKLYLGQLENHLRGSQLYYGSLNNAKIPHLTEAVELFKDRSLSIQSHDGRIPLIPYDGRCTLGVALRRNDGRGADWDTTFTLQTVLVNSHSSDPEDLIPVERCVILAENPALLVQNQVIYMLDEHEKNSFLIRNEKLHKTTVPADELSDLLVEFIPALLESNVPFYPDSSLTKLVEGIPEPVLTLQEVHDTLMVNLSFRYKDQRVDFSQSDQSLVPNTDASAEEILRGDEPLLFGVKRNHKKERELASTLSFFGLENVSKTEQHVYMPSDEPLLWIMNKLPELSQQGFQIYGEDLLKRFKKPRKHNKTTISLSSGEAWFELEGNLEFEDFGSVSIFDIQEVLDVQNGIIRVNGENGQLSQEWMNRLLQLLKLKKSSDDGKKQRFPKLSATLLDEWADEADEASVDSGFKTFLDNIKKIDKIEEISASPLFKGELRTYQQAGLSWLNFLYQTEMGGILADDMGLGKTIQVLALLAQVEDELNSKEENTADRKIPLSLIVAPRSVIYNWERETEKFLPHLPVYVHHGPDRLNSAEKLPENGIILTTYSTLRNDVELFEEIPLTYFIMDESHTIRNPESKTFRALRKISAQHRLCLSGTPVQNTIMDIWPQFELLNPGVLFGKKEFKKEWVEAIEKRQDGEKEKILNRMLEPFILRRTKEQVADDLPPISISDTSCELSGRQASVYEKYRKTYLGMLESAFEEHEDLQQSRFIVLEGLTRLRQICCSPALLKKAEYESIQSSKLERFTELASEVIGEGHRVLVFSQFVGFLNLIKKEVEIQGWKYSYLDGKTQNRKEVVDEFEKNKKHKLFLISLKAGGEGINLTSADYVFLMDPWWNPAAEKQAMDRSHRIGQKKHVMVYRFVTPGTVEEKITRLQERKKKLADSIIKAEAGVFKELDKKQLLELFL